jgi:hypothetical protein
MRRATGADGAAPSTDTGPQLPPLHGLPLRFCSLSWRARRQTRPLLGVLTQSAAPVVNLLRLSQDSLQTFESAPGHLLVRHWHGRRDNRDGSGERSKSSERSTRGKRGRRRSRYRRQAGGRHLAQQRQHATGVLAAEAIAHEGRLPADEGRRGKPERPCKPYIRGRGARLHDKGERSSPRGPRPSGRPVPTGVTGRSKARERLRPTALGSSAASGGGLAIEPRLDLLTKGLAPEDPPTVQTGQLMARPRCRRSSAAVAQHTPRPPPRPLSPAPTPAAARAGAGSNQSGTIQRPLPSLGGRSPEPRHRLGRETLAARLVSKSKARPTRANDVPGLHHHGAIPPAEPSAPDLRPRAGLRAANVETSHCMLTDRFASRGLHRQPEAGRPHPPADHPPTCARTAASARLYSTRASSQDSVANHVATHLGAAPPRGNRLRRYSIRGGGEPWRGRGGEQQQPSALVARHVRPVPFSELHPPPPSAPGKARN